MMKSNSENSAKKRMNAMFAVAILMCSFGLACTTKSRSKAIATDQNASASSGEVAGHSGSDPGIDLQCVMDHIQNPPDSFHYSYRKDASDHLVQEADVTPQTIDGSFTNEGFSRKFHGDRSDPHSWQDALSGVMGLSGMSSAIALVRNSSALAREESGQVNGYETIKYSIDTARGNGAERDLYLTVLGPGGFEKGEAWVTAQGCPVKLSLDSELHQKDGNVMETIHYQEAMVKK
jgi:hypothetical protein